MASAPRLYLHIGLQKTGTSYLQSIMWQNQRLLPDLGVDLVPPSKRDTFHLMLRVRDRYNPDFDPPAVAGALDRLPGQLATATAPAALITEESLAPATHEQIKALLAACTGREVHVVVTLRDLGRQIPSAWQQSVQSGQPTSYAEYLRRLRQHEGRPRSRYWSSKDVAAILERWAAHVPVERTHLVTVPPPGSPPSTLLERYCRVLGIDPGRLDSDVERSNESVGRVQAELLRRVNARLPREYRTRDVYGDIGKRYLAVRVLGPQGGEKLRVPREYEEWCRDVSQRYVDAIVKGGYAVEGDVLDLVPTAEVFVDDQRVRHQAVADSAVEAMATMLVDDMVKLRSRRQRQRRRSRRWLVKVRRVVADRSGFWRSAG